MAAVLKDALGVDAELVKGDRGEFSIWVAGRRVASKGFFGFPKETKVVAAVKQALAAATT